MAINRDKAQSLYRKSAELGYSDAYYALAVNAYNNLKLKERFMSEASDRNVLPAQLYFVKKDIEMIIQEHSDVYGVAENRNKMFECYEAYAKQGDPIAYYMVGELYYSGYGVEQSYEMAFESYKKALDMDKDLWFANYKLGWLYYMGQGVEQNKKIALKHYKIATTYTKNPIWAIPDEFHVHAYSNGVVKMCNEDIIMILEGVDMNRVFKK